MVSERKRVQTRLTREVPRSRCGWPWQDGVEGTREGGASARQQQRARSGSRGVGTVFPSLSGTYAVTLVFSCSLLDVANDFSSSSLLILLCLLAAQSLI